MVKNFWLQNSFKEISFKTSLYMTGKISQTSEVLATFSNTNTDDLFSVVD